jgi:hypothetical protein
MVLAFTIAGKPPGTGLPTTARLQNVGEEKERSYGFQGATDFYFERKRRTAVRCDQRQEAAATSWASFNPGGRQLRAGSAARSLVARLRTQGCLTR